MRNKKIAKCPRCCPDGGACFQADWNGDLENPVWKCCNCGYMKPRRALPRLDTPTKRMREIIDMLSTAFGGSVEVEMIGRKAFITLTNDARGFYNGRLAYGVVTSVGSYRIRLPRPCSEEIIIKDIYDMDLYFRRYNPTARAV